MKIIDSFFDSTAAYTTKPKVTRILVYPNITWAKDLEQDSYIQVIKKMISHLNEMRSDLWFYMLLPERVKSLAEFPNVTQWRYTLPTYPNQMRCHFDTIQLLDILDQKYEFDLIFSHLPEHTLQLVNLMTNKTHFHYVPVIGYCHWFETQEVTKYGKTVFPLNIHGILEMQKCYLNTKAQKILVITEARQWLNQESCNALFEKLEPLHLGMDTADIRKRPVYNTEKIIAFNHRPQAYKGFPEFMEMMDELWKQRQDFKVWIPLLEKPNREFVFTTKYEGQQYYDMLANCRVGVCMSQAHAGWSVSATDGLQNGTPFIFQAEPYYKELWDNADDFVTEAEGVLLLNEYLDDNDYRNSRGTEAISHCQNDLLYKYSISKLSDQIDTTVATNRAVSVDAEGYKKILKHIKVSGHASKESIMDMLGWGPSFDWSPYRARLRQDKHIQESYSEVPVYHYER
jgi:glycosyltransferase involved in cell wall biosynthesis